MRALKLTKAGLAEVDAVAEPLRAARLLEKRGKVLRLLGKSDGLDELRRAYELVLTVPACRETAEVFAAVAAGLMRGGNAEEIDAAATAAIAAAGEVGDVAQQVTAAITYARVCSHRIGLEEGLAEMRRVAAVAERTGDLDGLANARVNISDVLYELGRYRESAETVQASGNEVRRAGVGRTSSVYLVGNHAEALIALGRWDEAAVLLDDVLRFDPPGVVALSALIPQAWLRLVRGDASAAESTGGALAYLAKPFVDPQFRLPLLELRVATLLAGGGHADAVEAAFSALEDPALAPQAGYARYAWPLLGAVGDAVLATGNPRLRGALEEAVGQVPISHPPERAYAADVAAVLDGGVDAHLAAVAAWHADGRRYQTARALLRLAEAQAAAGDRAASADAVEEVLSIASSLDAAPLRAQAATLGRRIGVRAPSVPIGGPDTTLTSREREVLRLVAEGYSNGRIAETLFISPKTASVHVSRIIAKLDVSNRGEAAALAHRLGLLEAG